MGGILGAFSAAGSSDLGDARPCAPDPVRVPAELRSPLEAMARALGPGAQVVALALASDGPPRADGPGSATPLLVDWDCCWLDDRPVTSLDDWRSLLDAGRLSDVRGAFSLAGLRPDGTLLLARDGAGERTLYYALLPDGVPLPGALGLASPQKRPALAFSSTIRGLLDSGLVPRRLDPVSLGLYLSCAYVPGADTMVAGVRELVPGQVLHVRSTGPGAPLDLAPSWVWSLPAEAEGPADEDALRARLRRDLERAVRRRLPLEGPVAATLSGGIDSSLVVALARRLHAAPVHTFSVSFGSEYRNELPFSSLVASHCRTHHAVLELPPGAILRHLDESIALLSEPIGDPLTVPNALLFREACGISGAVLNGEGGDPCFGGPKNTPMLLAELLGHGADPDHDGRARLRSYLRSHQKCFDDLQHMLVPALREALADAALERTLEPRFDDPRYPSFVNKLMALNITYKGAHHILAKVDAVSFPFGVVPRSPLFDRDVVETAMATPPQLKLRGSVEKYLLKEAVRDLLPAEIVDRPKSGMLVPVEAWFQGPLLGEARHRLLDSLAPRGLFARDWLERLLGGRLGGLRPRRGAKIWLLVTLASYLESTGLQL